MSVAINYPFIIDVDGVVKKTTSTSKIYLDRIVTLLSTNIGQRPFYPDYGVDWSTSFFENENVASLAIPNAIRLAVARWIPEVSIEEIKLPALTDGVQAVNISVRLPSGSLTSLMIDTKVFGYEGTME